MRLDVLTIFPDYLAPLDLSLIGRARRDGLLDLRVHDLRDFTHDRHRTVDDTPLGGGAGMVMKPEPWAEAFASVVAAGRAELGGDAEPLVVFPNPAGAPFAQATAQAWSERPWLVLACGRYEGIDERVYEHLADAGLEVALASLGDYVLNGGEVAVLAITEAVVRLVPGVVGNAASLVEESHSDGLLEYPLYTRPATWTDPAGAVREAPAILLSGDHGKIAAWRAERSRERTAERRPDLLARREAPAAGDAPDTGHGR
ncbi:tRNA (guanosine(37)-N1)-methyltransferase TrmD [Brachybacterium sp. AOP25-B2-12]|uniref:tRNA (guanosine(37)-N1)-methyltransferase TrmD n=1 Tax=Brachybacterium sp. AOP25-B2-12 TaxID=3457710 RepID=UPI004034632D